MSMQQRSRSVKQEGGLAAPLLFSARTRRLELHGRAEIEGSADLGLEQRVFTVAVDVQRVTLIRDVLRFEDQREVVPDVPRRCRIDEHVRLVRANVAARRSRDRANVL